MLKDEDILAVKSPRNSVGGPYSIVYKTEYWAAVTLDYDDAPSIGIRWFDEGLGNPTSHGQPIWFIVPSELQEAILHSLPLRMEERFKIMKFLGGEISGEQLSQ